MQSSTSGSPRSSLILALRRLTDRDYIRPGPFRAGLKGRSLNSLHLWEFSHFDRASWRDEERHLHHVEACPLHGDVFDVWTVAGSDVLRASTRPEFLPGGVFSLDHIELTDESTVTVLGAMVREMLGPDMRESKPTRATADLFHTRLAHPRWATHEATGHSEVEALGRLYEQVLITLGDSPAFAQPKR